MGIMKKAIVSILGPFTLCATLGATNTQAEPLYTSKALITHKMKEVGCPALPKNLWSNHPSNNRTVLGPDFTGKLEEHFRFTIYCSENQDLKQSLKYNHPFTIAEILASKPENAILALRSVPPAQKEVRNKVARAAAIDMAQAAIDLAYPKGVNKHPFLKKSYETLKDCLRRLPTASQEERDKIHKQAYQLRLTLDRRNFLPSYISAAHAVAMAAATGESDIQLSIDHNSKDVDWVALHAVANAVESTSLWHFKGSSKKTALNETKAKDTRNHIFKQALSNHLPQ